MMRKQYSRTRRKLILRPVVAKSPSGEVTITAGINGWVIKARGLYASGRGSAALHEALNELAAELHASGLGIPAQEMQALAG